MRTTRCTGTWQPASEAFWATSSASSQNLTSPPSKRDVSELVRLRTVTCVPPQVRLTPMATLVAPTGKDIRAVLVSAAFGYGPGSGSTGDATPENCEHPNAPGAASMVVSVDCV